MKPSYFKSTGFICILIVLAIILSSLKPEASLAGSGGAKDPVKVWVKDPFKPPASVRGGGLPSSLTLSAILYGSERSSAMINGQMVGLGDPVQGYKVLDIEKTYVILSKAGRRVRLEMKK